MRTDADDDPIVFDMSRERAELRPCRSASPGGIGEARPSHHVNGYPGFPHVYSDIMYVLRDAGMCTIVGRFQLRVV